MENRILLTDVTMEFPRIFEPHSLDGENFKYSSSFSFAKDDDKNYNLIKSCLENFLKILNHL